MPPTPLSPRPALRLAILALLAAWAAWGLWGAMAGVVRDVERPPNPGAVAEWRLPTPRAESLEGFLLALDRRLPADRRIAFTAGSTTPDQEFFLTLWAAYLLPRHRVAHLGPGFDLARVDHVIAYNTELHDPRLREVGREFSGVLYRVEAEAGIEVGAGTELEAGAEVDPP